MIKILFFAKLREDLQCSELNLDSTEEELTVPELMLAVEQLKSADFVASLQDEHIVMAVNQTVHKSTIVIRDGDEVAFYPPVTGG